MKQSMIGPLAVVVAMLAPVLMHAQFASGPPPDPAAQFDAASIKPADPAVPGARMMMQPGRVEVSGLPVRMLLRQAFRVQDYQLVDLPDWASTERYSIVARTPDGSSPANIPAMITNLLKERFKLATHDETREMPIFNLVLARQDGRLGSNLKPTSEACQGEIQARRGGPPAGRAGGPSGPGGGPGPGQGAAAAGRGAPPALDFNQPAPCGSMRIGPGLAGASGQPIEQIVQMLAQFSGRPVYDKSGLTGLYDFDLKWAPEPGGAGPLGPPPPGAAPVAIDPDAPNLYTAVQEQLGLKLESARGPVPVVVIDRIERPSVD